MPFLMDLETMALVQEYGTKNQLLSFNTDQ